jgi:NAD(P)-dependent dehydrogenase (short-subunit alcohol dehydrogenase family)
MEALSIARAEARIYSPGMRIFAGDAFRGKTAIITGGASGIGAALARALAARGADVVIADRQIELADQLARELTDAGARVEAAELDVRDSSSVERLAKRTIDRTGAIDFLFNNAGIGVGGEMDAYDVADWDDVFDVNLRGVAYGVHAVYPHMVRRGHGHIINTASMAGLVSAAGEGSYTAAKHGVVGLSKSLRVEARRHGVRVSVLCPGAIRTPILTGGKYGRLNYVGLTNERILEMWSMVRPMDADVFADKALRAIAANEAIIVIPTWWKAFWYLERISPSVSLRLWEGMLAKMRRDIESSGASPRPQ